MNKQTQLKLLDEWRKIHETNFMLVQDVKHGKDLQVSPYDAANSIRAREIAEMLEPYLEELELLPTEKFELRQYL